MIKDIRNHLHLLLIYIHELDNYLKENDLSLSQLLAELDAKFQIKNLKRYIREHDWQFGRSSKTKLTQFAKDGSDLELPEVVAEHTDLINDTKSGYKSYRETLSLIMEKGKSESGKEAGLKAYLRDTLFAQSSRVKYLGYFRDEEAFAKKFGPIF